MAKFTDLRELCIIGIGYGGSLCLDTLGASPEALCEADPELFRAFAARLVLVAMKHQRQEEEQGRQIAMEFA